MHAPLFEAAVHEWPGGEVEQRLPRFFEAFRDAVRSEPWHRPAITPRGRARHVQDDDALRRRQDRDPQ